MTLSLLFAGTLSLGSALLSAGLILAFQRLMIVVLSLVAGRLIDRVGPYRVLVPCIVVVVGGLFALAHGVLYPAAIVIVLARALLSTTGPVLAASERAGTTVERLAAFATWVDSGLAVGPLIGGVAVARFGLPMLYQALAVAIGITLVMHRAGARGDQALAASSSALSSRDGGTSSMARQSRNASAGAQPTSSHCMTVAPRARASASTRSATICGDVTR